MKRIVLWTCALVLGVGATLLVFFPASWLGAIVERQSAGRFTLGDAQGTLWRGSAFIGAAASNHTAVTPLLPGRFSWSLSPLVLLGQLDVQLDNAAALSQVLNLSGSWTKWELSPATLLLPAAGLAGLGAPLNTIAPSGTLRLAWTALTLELAREPGPGAATLSINGVTTLTMTDMASRLSSVSPLGSYTMAFDWQGQQARLTLKTTQGPLLLDGSGAFKRGHLQFSGQAQAASGYEETLANLLNLLGQRRQIDNKNIIALEFKS